MPVPNESQLQRFVSDTRQTGGATMSQSGKMIPVHWEHDPSKTSHYMVGGARMESGKGERWPTSVVSQAQFAEHGPALMKSHIEGLQSRGAHGTAHVGSWASDGYVELDVSSVSKGGPGAERRAMELTKQRNEKAYFKTNPGQEVANPDYQDRLRPSGFTVAETGVRPNPKMLRGTF